MWLFLRGTKNQAVCGQLSHARIINATFVTDKKCVWISRIYKEEKAPEPPYWATKPLETAQALCPWYKDENQKDGLVSAQDALKFAPPGACYHGLTNNFSLITIELRYLPWLWGIPMPTTENPDSATEWTRHSNILHYVQSAASSAGMQHQVHYRTLVENVKKEGEKWKVTTGALNPLPSESGNEAAFRLKQQQWVGILIHFTI